MLTMPARLSLTGQAVFNPARLSSSPRGLVVVYPGVSPLPGVGRGVPRHAGRWYRGAGVGGPYTQEESTGPYMSFLGISWLYVLGTPLVLRSV